MKMLTFFAPSGRWRLKTFTQPWKNLTKEPVTVIAPGRMEREVPPGAEIEITWTNPVGESLPGFWNLATVKERMVRAVTLSDPPKRKKPEAA